MAFKKDNSSRIDRGESPLEKEINYQKNKNLYDERDKLDDEDFEEEDFEEDLEEEDPEEIYGLQKPRKTWSKKELDPMENAKRYELLSKLPDEAGDMLDYTTDTLEDTADIMNGNVGKSNTGNYPIELFRKNRRGI